MKKWMSLLLVITLMTGLTGCKSELGQSNKIDLQTADYTTTLFDQSYVHTIDIEISGDDWNDLVDNPTDKTKYQVDILIDGEKIEDVSFATKGNTSLTAVAGEEGNNRYSFKVNFGKFVEGQTYYGLEKLNLNNIYADATYMKDYMSYEIFRAAGVEAPLTSYVEVSINGEQLGLYLAIEDTGESYLERTEEGQGNLYKPETENLANIGDAGGKFTGAPAGMGAPNESVVPGNFGEGEFTPPQGDFEIPENSEGSTFTPPQGDFKMPENSEGSTFTPPQGGFEVPENSEEGTFTPPQGGFEAPDNFKGGGMNFGSTSNGASLIYTDDARESYTDIFDNAETDVTEQDESAVIAALKNLAEGNVEEAIDTTEVIKYFVAHNFVMNYDSYTGSMLHNYYLYEKDGLLSLLPWDYNLAFGTFMNNGMGMEGGNSSTDIVNYGIDTPLFGASEEERPMWSWIVNSDEYLEQYHDEYEKLIVNYFESGDFAAEMERVYEMIRPYVETDSSAFYTVDEFDTAYQTLSTFCNYRQESIRRQLNGELSAITDEQEESAKVDASDITISDMGSQNMGAGGNMDFNAVPGFGSN